jgi:spore germination protein
MGIFESIKKKLEGSEDKKTEKRDIPKDIDKTLKTLKDIFKDCDDVIFRDFAVGQELQYKFAVVCIDGLSDKNLIDNFILESLMLEARELRPSGDSVKSRLFKLTKDGALTTTEIKEVDDLNEIVTAILSADTALLLDSCDRAIVIGTKAWPARGPGDPKSEGVIRGPSDGFVETLRFNTALVRRRIRDPRFKIKQMQVGVRSKTDLAIMYMEDVVNQDLLQKVF